MAYKNPSLIEVYAEFHCKAGSVSQANLFDVVSTASAESLYNSALFGKIDALCNSSVLEIERYSKYEPGWDGYDGCSFSDNTILIARAAIEAIKSALINCGKVPEILEPGPASDGSIDIYLNINSNNIAFVIDPDIETINCYIENATSNHKQRTEIDLEHLERFVLWASSEDDLSHTVAFN